MKRNQGYLIHIINQYLEWNNLPFRWNASGVCKGLSVVHAQYFLAGQEELFFKNIDKIEKILAGNYSFSEEGTEPEEQLDYFISQILLAFRPEKFDNNYRQNSSYKTVRIDGKPLESVYELSLVTQEGNWSNIVRDINIQENEIAIVVSPNHAVTVHKKDNKYSLYDPNYKEGVRTFNSEKELIKELREQVFDFKDSNLALSWTLLTKASEKKPNIPRRDPQHIYEKYLKTDEEVLKLAHYGTYSISNAGFAALEKNSTLMNRVFQTKKNMSLDEVNKLVEYILLTDDKDLLELIIEKKVKQLSIEDQNKFYLFNIPLGLKLGGEQTTKVLMDTVRGSLGYDSLIQRRGGAALLLRYAVAGSSVPLLKNVLERIQKKYNQANVVSAITIDKGINHQTSLETAITSSSPQCLQVLLDTLTQKKSNLSEDTISKYLILAIQNNQLACVDTLLRYMDTLAIEDKEGKIQIIANLNISIALASKTNVHILTALEKKGAVFSEDVKLVMQEKKAHNLSMIQLWGLELRSFWEFILIKLGVKEEFKAHSNVEKEDKLANSYYGAFFSTNSAKENIPTHDKLLKV